MRTLEFPVAADPPVSICAGWIYAFGLYRPRWKIARHLNSDWSQAVLMAKRKSEGWVFFMPVKQRYAVALQAMAEK